MNKKGTLLINLGSPDSYDPKDVRKYLDEFLMDERVMDLPYWLRTIIVRGIILPSRPKRSAEAYKKIWWNGGSPLIVLSRRLQKKVQARAGIPVALAMRYGSMTIKKGLQGLRDQGVDKVLLIPLYPQFAMATTETITALAEELREKHFPDMTFETLPPFYNDPEYIAVLSRSIAEQLPNPRVRGDKTSQLPNYQLLFSYHGLPERHIKKRDLTKSHCKIDGQCCQTPSPAHVQCYRHQCYETTRLVAEKLGLEPGTYSTSFQSRLGVDPWLKPYTDRTIEKLALNGVKNLTVAMPAFVSDCIETLEEIAIEGKKLFLESGGENFSVIPCLNDRDDWARTLANWIDRWAIVDVKTAIA